MKKALSLLLAAIMILSLAACGTQETTSSQSSQNSEQMKPSSSAESTAPAEPAGTTTTEPAGTATTEESPAAAETPGDPEASGGEESVSKTLIVYFSPANSDTADAISSATPRVGDVSSVEYVAQLIGTKVDADVAKIIPEEAYPLPYNDAADQAKKEQDNAERPAFKLDVDPEDYDVIFVGYPVWWYEIPMVMDTFFDTYDFSGKTIIPFNTHAGSRDGGTYRDIAGLEPNATVLDGLAVSGERAGNAEGDVNDWLAGLGY